MKEAIVTPLLKKASLDPDILKNYRPVSALSFISKVIEKIVASRLCHHMQSHNLYEMKQSAYRKGHSTETALLRIQNDLLNEADKNRASCLVLLDLSAAFDTIDHNILLTRLADNVGLCGVPLKWFASYLTGRKQTIKAGSATSNATYLTCGVPQGSVLGPILFTVYTAPELGKIIRKHGLDYHMYADDTQLYISFNTQDTTSAISKLERCMAEIQEWMVINKLQLNGEKTDIVITGSASRLRKLNISTIKVGDATVSPSPHVRNLGVIFDSHLTMEQQVSALCKSCGHQIHMLGKIVKYLTPRATEQRIHPALRIT